MTQPKQPCRQTRYARAIRDNLRAELGEKCALCGATWDLQFDHIRGARYQHNKLSYSARMKRYEREHARGLTQAKLAVLTGIHRSVLARILTNEHGRGKETRHKLFPHLRWREIKALGWRYEYRQWLKAEQERMNAEILRDCRGPCALCSTTNIVPDARTT
jgi:5-methylcytosine-specific restriction endonuclease McrA